MKNYEDCCTKDYCLSKKEIESIIENIARAKTKKIILQNGIEVYVKETCFVIIDGLAFMAHPFLDIEGKWGFYYYNDLVECKFVYDEKAKDLFFSDIDAVAGTNLKLIAEVLKKENK